MTNNQVAESKPLIVLASQSRSRIALLKQTGLEFLSLGSGLNEAQIEADSIQERVVKLAGAKAREVALKVESPIIIAADTVVVCNGLEMEKPKFKMEAVKMLQMLQGRIHVVLTGWTVLNKAKKKSFEGYSETEVTFRNLSDEEIISYVDDHEVVRWAGGYNPLDSEAIHFVKKIKGSLSGLYGLPLESIVPLIKKEL